jgi:Zn-dependent protease
MSSTLRLGRVSGIQIGAHWSWLLVVALIIWTLADAVFPETNPGHDDGTYIAMAAVAAALFFASITAARAPRIKASGRRKAIVRQMTTLRPKVRILRAFGRGLLTSPCPAVSPQSGAYS